MKVDWLIVGAGLTGATFAERIASKPGNTVLLVDQRDHIAGNAWDEYNEHGILEHKYGPHIFHTNDKEVWEYLSQFTQWKPYFHKVLAFIDGKFVPLPFNLNSIEQLFPAEMATRISSKLIHGYGFGSRVPILKLRDTEDPDLRFLADYVYKSVFENYTTKQWGIQPEELLPSVTARVPILVSRDNRYFQDRYQAIPLQGFGTMVRSMIKRPNIRLMLNTSWLDIKDQVMFKNIVFTGSIDEFFDFKYGELPYRSLRFDVQTHPFENYQDAAVVNFPNDCDYTRITEHKLITGQFHRHTTTSTEYPLPHVSGKNIPYYPIPTNENRLQYKLYENEILSLGIKVIFSGRLADYMYYNMDQAVKKALVISRGYK